MIYLMILLCTVAAVVCDWYIYRRMTARHRLPRAVKILYIAFAFLIDLLVVFSILRMRSLESMTPTMTHAVMWANAIFFLNLIPKLIYTLVSSLDYLRGLFTRRRSRIFGWIGLLVALPVALAMLHGMTLGRSQLRYEQVTYDNTFAKLPRSFDDLKVIVISDMHIGTLINRDRFLERLRDRINGENADIVIHAGDLVNSQACELDPAAIEILRGIRARYGVYAVLGNHDLGIYVRDAEKYPPALTRAELERKHEELGWKLLRNETEYISNGRDSIAITGVDFPYDPSLNSNHVTSVTEVDLEAVYAAVPDSIFNITIAHTPNMWNGIRKIGKADLTVSGHVHSMQIKLQLGGFKWSPAQWVYEHWSGAYMEDGQALYVNDGLGYVMYPMRIGTKPEITGFVFRNH